MSLLLEQVRAQPRVYWDRTQFPTVEAQSAAKAKSSTVYVGGLSPFSVEEQIHALFSKAGVVRRVVMGLHRVERTPCGFCFVEFERRGAAVAAQHLLSAFMLDGKELKVELDPGFREGRQYGRARSGGQMQEERRKQMQRGGRGGRGDRERDRGRRGREDRADRGEWDRDRDRGRDRGHDRDRGGQRGGHGAGYQPRDRDHNRDRGDILPLSQDDRDAMHMRGGSFSGGSSAAVGSKRPRDDGSPAQAPAPAPASVAADPPARNAPADPVGARARARSKSGDDDAQSDDEETIRRRRDRRRRLRRNDSDSDSDSD